MNIDEESGKKGNTAGHALRSLAVSLLFFAMTFAVFWVHVEVFSPPMARRDHAAPDPGDRSAIAAAMSPQAVSNRFAAISALGSRAPGQAGLDAAADLIERAFGEKGLEVFRQEVEVPYPLLLDGSGWMSNEIFRLDVLPFRPNYVQTVTTGADGIDGELFLATEEAIRKGRDFTGKIAVLDTAGSLHPDLGLDPVYYADFGFSAVIVTHSDGLEKAPWAGGASRQTSLERVPVNIVRVACGPEVLGHIGEKVHLDVRSTWGSRRTRNVIGVMRGGDGTATNRAAVIIPIEYSACSFLPDHAAGSLKALQTAVMLQLTEGLASYRRSFSRDVVFVAATGSGYPQEGMSRLISTIGENGRRDFPPTYIKGKIDEHRAMLDAIARVEALFDDSRFAAFGQAELTRQLESGLDSESRRVLEMSNSRVLRGAVFEQSERLLQARIAYQRDPSNLVSPEFAAFRAAKRDYDEMNNLSALPLAQALDRQTTAKARFTLPDGSKGPLREAIRAMLRRFADFHRDRLRSFEEDLALQRLFAQYDDIVVLGAKCVPTSGGEAVERVGVACGRRIAAPEGLERFKTLVAEAAHRIGLDREVEIALGDRNAFSSIFTDQEELCTLSFAAASYSAFTIASVREKVRDPRYPFRQEALGRLDSARRTLALVGETALALAGGQGTFDRLPICGPFAVRGSVFASNIGSSAVPNYPVEGALVCSRDKKSPMITDIYGQYESHFNLLPTSNRDAPYDAFLFDADGGPLYVKDFGSSAQLIYSSRTMRFDNAPVNHVLYRGAPVALLDRINPQTLNSYSGLQFVRRRGLSAFQSTSPFSDFQVQMDFLPPDERFFLLLKDGAPDNEYVATTRAFCLGTLHADEVAWTPTENEIDGPGYLPADTPFFRNASAEALASMSWLAGKRLALQRRYGMTDELTLSFDATSRSIASNVVAEAGTLTAQERRRELGHGLSYQILNHPVIRGTISEAVIGIVWYLGLLVPFVFFFEKLTFGFADIRRALLVQGVVFLVAFGLLRALHPAFHMIRSSAMILLGFAIMLTVGTVTLLLSGKFKENLDAIRGGTAPKGVAGNKLAIAMTAFLLGLNNMHRRRMRTGLTCATLALMTFVMACFTSIQSNVVETERATGSAGYQGFVIRKKDFRAIPGSECVALPLAFPNHPISERKIYAAYYEYSTQRAESPTFTIEFGEGDNSRSRSVRTALGFTPAEPLADLMPLLSTNGWFTAAQQAATEGARPLIIPDVVADQLGITPAMVDAGPVPVLLNGGRFFIHNIFDSARFAEVTDIDGSNLLPFDGLAMNNFRFCDWGVFLAGDDDPRVAPSDLIIIINDDVTVDWRALRTVSAAVDMRDVPYAVARREISMYKERCGTECHYALGGTSFMGQRARSRSLAGLADIIIPLVIAAITVLNTMKGSVYERRGEIQVYNAVGIAPRYIFFMFVAEALVYAVVGTVTGCLLAQAVGRLLSALGATAGMDMNFASLTTVYASLAIAGATLLSTIYPAMTAMEIAKPADNAGWSLPAPDADGRLSITLPFTFTHRDRIAVLAFLHDYFDSLGEGSAGVFFSGRPELRVSDRLDELADGAYIPELKVRIWLKPFDLGVSQDVEIELGTDPDTREYIARMTITRVTGTLDSWYRLNRPFVAAVRRQFLHWRAVGEAQKTELFAEARSLLERA